MFACSVVYASRTFLMTCCAAWAPRPRIRISTYVCFRSSYSRGTPRSNATCDTQFAASLHSRRVARSATASSTVGSSLTCTTIFTLRTVLLDTDNQPDADCSCQRALLPASGNHRPAGSRQTASSKTAPLRGAVVQEATPPGPEGPGFLARSR